MLTMIGEYNKVYMLEKRHFDLFQDYFLQWAKFFGLKNWDFHFYWDILGNENERGGGNENEEGKANNMTGVLTYVKCAPILSVCEVHLNKQWLDTEPTPEILRRLALHESLEVLLDPIDELARARFASSDDLSKERHRVVQILENAFSEIMKQIPVIQSTPYFPKYSEYPKKGVQGQNA